MNNNPFSFKGTLSRLPFFITTCILGIVFIFSGAFAVALKDLLTYNLIHNIPNGNNTLIFWILAILSNLCAILLAFAFIKRLRDVNKSGYWLLVCFIPFAVLILWVYLLFKQTHNE